MYTTRNQEDTLQDSRAARSLKFGLLSGWLLVGLAGASLIGGLIWSDSWLRYPSAEQLATHFQFDALATGVISQQSAYQTPDDLPQVMGWYVHHLGLGHDVLQLHHVRRPLLVFRCAGRAGQPHRERQGDRKSRAEADSTEDTVFRFHYFLFHFAGLCLCLFQCLRIRK